MCTAIRARRRMPKRNQQPDHHIQREHRLGLSLWAIVPHYRAWLAGSLDDTHASSVNELLGLVLGPAGSGSLSFIDDAGQDGRDLIPVDVGMGADAHSGVLCGLGWTSFPSVSELTGHILDRLEYDWALRLPEEAHIDSPFAAPVGTPVGVDVDGDGGFFDPYDPELPEYGTLI